MSFDLFTVHHHCFLKTEGRHTHATNGGQCNVLLSHASQHLSHAHSNNTIRLKQTNIQMQLLNKYIYMVLCMSKVFGLFYK